MRPKGITPSLSLAALVLFALPLGCQIIAGVEDMEYVEPPDASADTSFGGTGGGTGGGGGDSGTGGTGGTSAQDCVTDDPCTSDQYCAASGQCASKKAAGTSCSDADCKQSGCEMCETGLTCLDGVCCKSDTCPACRNCGSTGECSVLVTNAEDDTCTDDRRCNPEAACRSVAGSTCVSGVDCLSGYCVDGVCCGNANCPPCRNCGASGDCSEPVVNQDDTTGTTCMGQSSCGAAGECKSVLGASCASNDTCLSNYCVDYRCCDTAVGACNGCKYCDTDGVCKEAAENTDPNDVCGGYWCKPYPPECFTSCFCSSGTMCNNAVDGGTSAPHSQQCKTGYYCDAGVCKEKLGSGSNCGFNFQCKSTCYMGVCTA